MRVALTDRFVAGIKGVAGRQQEYFDTKAVGLALRVSPAGTRTWNFHGTDGSGRRCRVKLGSYPAMPLAAARAAALQARGAAEAGNDPRSHRSDAMTVSALVDNYISKRVRSALRNAYQVKRRLQKNVTPVIGTVRLADLHRRDVNRVIDVILARDCPAEANSVFADLRAMLRWAVRRGDLDHDPTAGMAMPAPARFRERALSEPEIAQLWQALPTTLADSVDAQRILRLCLITGQRIGEVAGITRTEIDLASREWRLPASRSKNKHPHTIPLSGSALSTINEALAAASGQKLFAITANQVARRVKDAQDAIGIVRWTPHDLRRSTLTQMAKLGVEPIVIGHVANHRTTTKAGVTLAIYVKHSYEVEKRRALELWADRLQAIVDGNAAAEVIRLGERAR
jgi:integrase